MPPSLVTDVPAAMLRAIDLVAWTAPKAPAADRAPAERRRPADPVAVDVLFEEVQALFAEDAAKARTGAKADLAALRRMIERTALALEASDVMLGLACATTSRPVDPVALHRARALVFALATGLQLGYAGARLVDLGLTAARVDAGTPRPAAALDDTALRTTTECFARLLGPTVAGRGLSPYAALHGMVRGRHGVHVPAALRALIGAVGCFPPGTLVRLNSGDTGRVISVNRRHPLRPGLEIVRTMQGQRLTEPRRVDLAEAPFLHIVGPLEGEA